MFVGSSVGPFRALRGGLGVGRAGEWGCHIESRTESRGEDRRSKGKHTHAVVVDDLDDGRELALERTVRDEDDAADFDVALEGRHGRLGCGGHGCRRRGGLSARGPWPHLRTWSSSRSPSVLLLLRIFSTPPPCSAVPPPPSLVLLRNRPALRPPLSASTTGPVRVSEESRRSGRGVGSLCKQHGALPEELIKRTRKKCFGPFEKLKSSSAARKFGGQLSPRSATLAPTSIAAPLLPSLAPL